MKAIKNVMIYDYVDFYKSAYVIFDDVIIGVGDMSDFNFDGEVIDGKGKLLMPGLLNGHTHIYSTLIRGLDMVLSVHSFQDILDQLWWRWDAGLDNEMMTVSGHIYALESLKNGVTALIDHHASGVEIVGSIDNIRKAVSEDIGLRGLYCFETSDRYDVRACVSENNKSSDLFGLHASMSLSDATLQKVQQTTSKPIHIHVAESIEDEVLCTELHGIRVVERLEKFGLLKDGSLLSHCVHIDEDEAKIIKKKKCVVALNPTSNMNNAVGIFDYDLLKSYEIPVIVGTDGLGSNVAKEWLNMFYLGKMGLQKAVGIDLNDVLNSIVTSYKYFSSLSGIKIGRIKPGYKADLVLLDYNAPTKIDKQTIFAHVLYGVFERFSPSYVWVDGDLKIENYEMTMSIKTYYKNAIRLSSMYWERVMK